MLPFAAQNAEEPNPSSDRPQGSSPHIANQTNIAGDVHAAGDFVGGDKIVHNHHYYTASVGSDAESASPLLAAELSRQPFEPETILIPAATFWMGRDAGAVHETPRHPVTLPAYRIGKALVNNAQYAAFIAHSKEPVPAELGWNGQQPDRQQRDLPVTGVTFFDALRYCQWLQQQTGRPYTLPHEAAWEGASVLPTFVWGNGREWTTTLWGESLLMPDEAYRYPWQDDERNAVNAARHLRRVIRGENRANAQRRRSESPDQPGAPGKRLGFRVYLPIKGSTP